MFGDLAKDKAKRGYAQVDFGGMGYICGCKSRYW